MTRQLLVCTAIAGMSLTVCLMPASTAVAQGGARYEFAVRRHLDELAHRMWQDANEVCWEMVRFYGHNPGYRETYRKMYRVMKDAQHIHDLVHEGYHFGHHDVDHIARDLFEIDRLFHDVERCIRGWSPSFPGERGDYGAFVHGRPSAEGLLRRMHLVEQTLHHLMADYGVKSQLPGPQTEIAPPRPLAPAQNGVSRFPYSVPVR